MPKQKVYWPSWRFSTSGEGKIFNKPEDVPPGWYETREDAAAMAEAEKSPPENGSDAWGGYAKEFLHQTLRSAGEKVHANLSARKAYEKCVDLGLIGDNQGE